jgi:hypothetical protein
MNMYGEVAVYIHIFLTLALVGSKWSATCSNCLIPSIHWIGGWLGPTTGLDDMERRNILLYQDAKF